MEDGEVRVSRIRDLVTCYPPIVPMDDEDALLAATAAGSEEQEQPPIVKMADEEERVACEEDPDEIEQVAVVTVEDEEEKEAEARIAGRSLAMLMFKKIVLQLPVRIMLDIKWLGIA